MAAPMAGPTKLSTCQTCRLSHEASARCRPTWCAIAATIDARLKNSARTVDEGRTWGRLKGHNFSEGSILAVL